MRYLLCCFYLVKIDIFVIIGSSKKNVFPSGTVSFNDILLGSGQSHTSPSEKSPPKRLALTDTDSLSIYKNRMSEKLKIALLKCVYMLAADVHYEGYVNLSPEPKVNTGVDNSAQTNPIKVTAVIFQWLCVPFLFANEVCMLMS
jgi:hypothetical protein